MEEIAILELKQKRLITMLSQIDPVIYLQKLQQELSALQVSKLKFTLAWNHQSFFILATSGNKQKTQAEEYC